MKVVQLDSFDKVQEYGTCWDDLLGVSRDNHVFLTLEWLETWWKHFGANRKLLLLAVIDSNRILALAPLMQTTYRLFGAKLRNIEFIGTPASDYHGFILINESSTCAKMLLSHINTYSWDCIELKNIPENSQTSVALKANSREPIELKERVIDTCYYVPLPNTTEEYLQKLHRKTRQGLRRLERKLRNERKIEFKLFDDFSSVEEAMRIFFKLHQLRWQSQGREGRFTDPAFRDFHGDVARLFAEKGWLRLSFLTADGEPISANYCFEYRQKLYGYLTGFDPRYSRYGVGSLSILSCIKDCIERDLEECDMLRGGHSYKNIWNSLSRRNFEISAMRLSPISKAYELLVKSEIVPSLSRKLRRHALMRQAARKS